MEERDDYPIIQQPENKYKCADCGAEMNEGEAATFTVCDSCWYEHYKKQHLEVETGMMIEPNHLEKELASLKEVVKELIPIAEERLRRIVNYDMPDYHKVTSGIKSIIDRAKTLLR